MLTITTKLHIILVCTVIAVGLYMYFLYKELKTFQGEVIQMKQQVNMLMKQQISSNTQSQGQLQQENITNNEHDTTTQTIKIDSKVDSTTQPAQQQMQANSTEAIIVDTNDDDTLSVTSNDIKDILTNIQSTADEESVVKDVESNDNDIDEVIEETQISFEDEITLTEKKPWPDYASMTDEELSKVRYDDLRAFLRGNGQNVKGSKQELINKIKELVRK